MREWEKQCTKTTTTAANGVAAAAAAAQARSTRELPFNSR